MSRIKNWRSFNEGMMLDLLTAQLTGANNPSEVAKKELGDPAVTGSVEVRDLSGEASKNAELVKKYLNKYGMTNPYLQVAVLGCIGKECGFIPKNEYSYSGTSNNRLRQIFGKRMEDLTDAELDQLKKSDKDFYEKIYGGRFGNTEYGDGYKYRGRGFNGITFKANYENMQKMLAGAGVNVDIVNNPDKLNDPEIAAEAAVLFFKSGLENPKLYQNFGIKDPNQFKSKDDAIQAVVNVNAGWQDVSKSNDNYIKAVAYANKFDLEAGPSMA